MSSSQANEAPISQVVHAFSQSASFVISNLSIVVRGLFVTISSLVSFALALSPIPVILYVFAPVLVFLQITFGLLILSPYAIALSVLDALYPIYVFFGVACIAGALIGLGGRTLAAYLTALVLKIGKEAEIANIPIVEVVTQKRRPSRISAS